MRLWHKDLICVLPRQQLLSQWRECCCIARNIAVNGTPNHMLVNKVLDYPVSHFNFYTKEVIHEMERRLYRVSEKSKNEFYNNLAVASLKGYFNKAHVFDDDTTMFLEWHNDRYLMQCYLNLQEKYDCGGITDIEWDRISSKIKSMQIKI